MYQRIGGWVAHVSSYIFKVLYLFYFEKKNFIFLKDKYIDTRERIKILTNLRKETHRKLYHLQATWLFNNLIIQVGVGETNVALNYGLE